MLSSYIVLLDFWHVIVCCGLVGRHSTGTFTEDALDELQGSVGVAKHERKVGPCITNARTSLRAEVKTGASVHSRKTVFQAQRLLLACN